MPGVALPMMIVGLISFVFAIMLVIAPLMIWNHLAKLRVELRDALSQMKCDQAKIAADVRQMRVSASNTDTGVPCPKCGKQVQPNENGTGRCGSCGQMFRIER